MKICVENAYSDGYESSQRHVIDDADVPRDIEDMWDLLWEYTGDGHGDHSGLDSCYTITIEAAADPVLVGLSREWC